MRRAFFPVVLLACVVAASTSLPASAGAYPGENGEIVYVAGGDIFTVDRDGTDVTNLTNTPGLGVDNLSASPDGKRIAFNVNGTVLDQAGLYVISMNGVTIRDVLAGRHDAFIEVGAPTWAPDGKRIAFEAYQYAGFRNEMFVIDADGTDLKRLTNCNCVASTYPVWSPAGPEIAFMPCCSGAIVTLDVETLATTEVFAPESGEARNLTWSPDGTQLAFDDLIEVFRVSIPNGTPVALTHSGPGFYSNPSWSPDGTKILVESNHESPQSTNRDIYAIDATQGVPGGVARITSAPDSEGQPEWAPLCEGRCTATVMSLRVSRTRTAVKASGRIRPAVPGRATVTLLRKGPSGFRRIGSKQAGFDTEGLFEASFGRPARGRCRVQARYAGDAEREPSVVVKSFTC